MLYRTLTAPDAERLGEIDGHCHIQRAWRVADGQRRLIELDWTDHALPNGLPWHVAHFKASLAEGGYARGCFFNGRLIGYAVANGARFGSDAQYLLLDQLYVSNGFRRQGIGRQLFADCCAFARARGARKLYLCAGSSEDTVAFYRRLGCVDAAEIDSALADMDPNDWHMEYALFPPAP